MFDDCSRYDAPPRAIGAVRIAARHARGASRLARLRQSGSAKCLLPRSDGVLGVLVNTAGGIAGGDRFDWQAEVEEGAALTLTTQACERAYRAVKGQTARVTTRLTAGPGAALHWLPQETILFDGCALSRRIEADVAPDATLLLAESLILGREAMGETVATGHFEDRWQIRRGGKLLQAEAFRLSGNPAAEAARPWVFGPNRAAATILLVTPEAEDRLPAIRAHLEDMEAGASAWEGRVLIRMLAPSGAALRRRLMPLLAHLAGQPLPRPWTM